MPKSKFSSNITPRALCIIVDHNARLLARDVREKIRYKHRLWNQYIETRDLQYLTKYKKIRNNIRRITRQKQKNQTK